MITRKVLLLVAAAFAMAAMAQDPKVAVPLDAAQLERRIEAVETLIERSSAARQIESSAVATALEGRERARGRLREARSALRTGDLVTAGRLLPQASALMFDAARLAAPEQVTAPKARLELEEQLQSARSLAAAQKRVVAEKNVANGAQTTRDIERLIAQAEADAAAGRQEAALGAARQAYLLAKVAIGSMRGGDTLVRTLTFANKEEEYLYEVDRNDTHRMLLNLLLEGARAGQAQEAIGRASQLRGEAEALAHARDFGGAVRQLEESTRELVRAIRGAGVYIPG